MPEHYIHDIDLAEKRRREDRPDLGPAGDQHGQIISMPPDYMVTTTAGIFRALYTGLKHEIEHSERMAQWARDNADRADTYQKWHTDVQHDFTQTKNRLYDRIEELEAQLVAQESCGRKSS